MVHGYKVTEALHQVAGLDGKSVHSGKDQLLFTNPRDEDILERGDNPLELRLPQSLSGEV